MTKDEILKDLSDAVKESVLPFLAGRNRGIESCAEVLDGLVERDASMSKVAQALREMKT